MLHYSREAEREADEFAVQEMYDAGIDPDGMATFFEKLLALHEDAGGEPSGFQALFTTHPNTQERVDNARRMIADLPAKANLKKDTELFRRIKNRLPAIERGDTGEGE